MAVEKHCAEARCLQGSRQIIFIHGITLLFSFLFILIFYVSWVRDVLRNEVEVIIHKEILMGWCLSPLKCFIPCQLL